MSNEAWIGLSAILVTLGLAGASAVFGLVGWFLSRMIASNDRELQQTNRDVEQLRRENIRQGNRLTRIETVMSDRGWIKIVPTPFPSPPTLNIEEGNP